MPELNVYFFGLICHVDVNTANGRPDYAAIVRAGTHQAFIHFEHSVEPIEGNISFKHGFAPPDTASDYQQYVPKLRSIVGGALAIDEDEVWRFLYPSAQTGRAELSVADYYGYNGIHRSKGSNQVKRGEAPVARIVRLRVPLEDNNVTVLFSSDDSDQVREKVIPSSSCILITNLEAPFLRDAGVDLKAAGVALNVLASYWAQREAHPATQLKQIADRIEYAGENLKQAARTLAESELNHFEHYSIIVAGADTAVAKRGKKLKNKPPAVFACDWVRTRVKSLDHDYYPRGASRPECGNTNWP